MTDKEIASITVDSKNAMKFSLVEGGGGLS